jgi:hypothetical protein
MADGSDGNAVVIATANAKKTFESVGKGEVGLGTAGSRIKNLHRATGRGLTLKAFVASQVKDGNPDATEWLSNKGPTLKNKAKAARFKLKGGRILLEKQATKLARQPKKR